MEFATSQGVYQRAQRTKMLSRGLFQVLLVDKLRQLTLDQSPSKNLPANRRLRISGRIALASSLRPFLTLESLKVLARSDRVGWNFTSTLRLSQQPIFFAIDILSGDTWSFTRRYLRDMMETKPKTTESRKAFEHLSRKSNKAKSLAAQTCSRWSRNLT